MSHDISGRSVPGSDGLVRSVEVRAKGTTYRRPITKISLLEQVGSGEIL